MSNIEDFLESMNYIPVDMRRNLGLMKELEYKEAKVFDELERAQKQLLEEVNEYKKQPQRGTAELLKFKTEVERLHMNSLVLRREKILVAEQAHKILQSYNKNFDSELTKFEEEFRNFSNQESTFAQAIGQDDTPQTQAPVRNLQSKRNREHLSYSQMAQTYDNSSQYPTHQKTQREKQKKKSSQQQIQQEANLDEGLMYQDQNPICYCQQPSYGAMVGCDMGSECRGKEWYHIGCVGLTEVPDQDEAWYCPDCKNYRNM